MPRHEKRQAYMLIFVIFNETLTNDTVKLEQPGLGRLNHCPASAHYMNVSVLIKFSQKTSVFTLKLLVLHKIICFGCVLESPR